VLISLKKLCKMIIGVRLITNEVNFESAAKPRNNGIRHAKVQDTCFFIFIMSVFKSQGNSISAWLMNISRII